MTLICVKENLLCNKCHLHAILNKPSNRLNPVLELVVTLWRDLKSGARRQYRVGELFIVGDRQMIELCVNTLNIPELSQKVAQLNNRSLCMKIFLLTFADIFEPAAAKPTANVASPEPSCLSCFWPDNEPTRWPPHAV